MVGRVEGKILCLRVPVDLLVWGMAAVTLGAARRCGSRTSRLGSPGEQWPQVTLDREGWLCEKCCVPVPLPIAFPIRWLSRSRA